MTLGDVLRAWRLDRGLSQAEAAERVGVTQPTWSDWEAGKKLPNFRSAHRLIEIVGHAARTALLDPSRGAA